MTDPPDLNWAYSDASMQPYGQRAVLATVLEGQTIVQVAPVTSVAEAELLAAELAVSHAPAGCPLRLHVDNTFAIDALTDQYGHAFAFRSLGHDILALAQARGIALEVAHVSADANLAHQPAILHYRSLECRPRLNYHFHAKGPLVRVRGEGVDFRGVYEAPAGFYAMCELAEQLPAGVIAQVRGLMPLAWAYWHNPKKGDSQVKKRAKQALKVLAAKDSDIQLCKADKPSILHVIK